MQLYDQNNIIESSVIKLIFFYKRYFLKSLNMSRNFFNINSVVIKGFILRDLCFFFLLFLVGAVLFRNLNFILCMLLDALLCPSAFFIFCRWFQFLVYEWSTYRHEI